MSNFYDCGGCGFFDRPVELISLSPPLFSQEKDRKRQLRKERSIQRYQDQQKAMRQRSSSMSITSDGSATHDIVENPSDEWTEAEMFFQIQQKKDKKKRGNLPYYVPRPRGGVEERRRRKAKAKMEQLLTKEKGSSTG
mmetsp:Transcript_12238/g.16003  ORF Transcript_12238/g.16003 Transcript_12238/m.16003 type:complete len:138 (-) Transcript_12238:264-677(-)